MKNIGDKIAAVATPIARLLNLSCIDPQTNQLKPESTCSKVKQDLNEGRYADAFYDRFWKQAKQRRQNSGK